MAGGDAASKLGRVVAGAGDGDHVQRSVELAVLAAVKAQVVALSRGRGYWGDAGLASEARVGAVSLSAGGTADQNRGGQRATARLSQQRGR